MYHRRRHPRARCRGRFAGRTVFRRSAGRAGCTLRFSAGRLCAGGGSRSARKKRAPAGQAPPAFPRAAIRCARCRAATVLGDWESADRAILPALHCAQSGSSTHSRCAAQRPAALRIVSSSAQAALSKPQIKGLSHQAKHSAAGCRVSPAFADRYHTKDVLGGLPPDQHRNQACSRIGRALAALLANLREAHTTKDGFVLAPLPRSLVILL